MSAIARLPGEGKSVTLGPNGMGVVFKLYAEDTRGLFSLVEHPIPPGIMTPPHLHHNEDEYSYVLEGEVAFQLGDEVTYAKPGTLIAKPRGIWHAFWNESSSPARILEIIAPGGFEHYFEEMVELFANSQAQAEETRLRLAEKYHIDYDWSRVQELAHKHGLTPPGGPPHE